MKNKVKAPSKTDQSNTNQRIVLDPNYSNNLNATLPLDNLQTMSNDDSTADSSTTPDYSKVGKTDNEYARINKSRKVATPTIPGDEQTYDKVSKEKKVNNDLHYDKVKQDTKGDDTYDTTVKAKTAPATDGLYDGLSRF